MRWIQKVAIGCRHLASNFYTELTTLTADMLADAESLADAVQILKREYSSRDRLWASWSDYDRRQFERVCNDQGVANPFGQSHLKLNRYSPLPWQAAMKWYSTQRTNILT